MDYKIAALSGDGVGVDIMDQALKVLKKVEDKFFHRFEIKRLPISREAVDLGLDPLPKETEEACRDADGVLLGKISLNSPSCVPFEKRPESSLNYLRDSMELLIDARPAFLWKSLKELSPLNDRIFKGGMDLLVIRDLNGGMYKIPGKTYEKNGERVAEDLERYEESQIEDTFRLAISIAKKREKILYCLDKEILLDTSKLWRRIGDDLTKDDLDIDLKYMLVDQAATSLVSEPSKFNVIVSTNVFGDIISDLTAGMVGACEVLPAASFDGNMKGLFYPNQLHRSEDDKRGRDEANPLGLILSLSMMFKYSFGLNDEARAIEEAVKKVLDQGYATEDIKSPGKKIVSTSHMGDLVSENI